MIKKLCVIVIPLMILIWGCKTNKDAKGFWAAPVLISPENGSTVSENPPTLTWQRVGEIMYYEITLTAEGDSGDSFIRQVYVPYGGDTVSYAFDIVLPSGNYTWMARCLLDVYT